jgi:hypothetical protein
MGRASVQKNCGKLLSNSKKLEVARILCCRVPQEVEDCMSQRGMMRSLIRKIGSERERFAVRILKQRSRARFHGEAINMDSRLSSMPTPFTPTALGKGGCDPVFRAIGCVSVRGRTLLSPTTHQGSLMGCWFRRPATPSAVPWSSFHLGSYTRPPTIRGPSAC